MVSLNYRTCDKPGFNGIFKWELEGEYTIWAEKKHHGGRTKQWCR